MKAAIFTLSFILASLMSFEQTDAQIRSRKIREVNTEITEMRKGKLENVKIKETYLNKRKWTFQKWNASGELIEMVTHECDRKGVDELLIEHNLETLKPEKIHEFIYDRFGKLLLEKVTDSSDKLIETTEYTYGVRGEKLMEMKRDQDKKLIRQTYYNYDKKGMLTQKIVKDGDNKVIYEKKVDYVY